MAFWELIKSLPAILSAFVELKKLFDQYIAAQDRAETLKKLTDAMAVARQTKDTKTLEDVLRSIVNS